jgi:hypothetical protein
MHEHPRLPIFLLSTALSLCAATLTAQEDTPAAPKAPDPQVAKDVAEFLRLVNDKEMSKDEAARTYLAKWVQAYETMHQKDQTNVANALDAVFSKAKQRPPEKLQLYEASAVALSRMGKHGAKVLKAAFSNAKFGKPDWIALRGRLIGALGQTQDLGSVDFILDTALRDPEDQIMAKAGEALGHFEKADLKVRREIVKKLLKRFVEIHNQSRTESLDDPVAETRKRTYAAIADPWNTTLAKLSGQAFRSPQDWEKWWNNHKDDAWDNKG